MTTKRIKNVAFFKVQSVGILPTRPGPIQCIKNCTNCIMKTKDNQHWGETEELISIMSFDNLVTRKSLWFFQYQSLQYHTGQLELLKRSLAEGAPSTMYIVACTETKDLKFLNMIFDYTKQVVPYPVNTNIAEEDIESFIRKYKTIVIPVYYKSCVSDGLFSSSKSTPCSGAERLRDLLEPCIKRTLNNNDFDINIVPVTITKDHDRLKLYGFGSVSVQIQEPYRLSAYLNGLKTSQKSTHLVQHVYYDLAKGAAILPSHIVAFLLLNLERENGVELSELVEYVDWFRKVAIDFGMHIGFTGSSKIAVEVALVILKDFVTLISDKYYQYRDIDSLMDYADIVVPYISYYGILATAILKEHSRNGNNKGENQPSIFVNEVKIRVMKEKVIKTGHLIAEKLEQKIPCRRPCTTIENCVEETIDHLHTFGHYLKIEEPAFAVNRGRRWAGDSEDEDEEYFRSKQDDPAFKTWLSISNRSYRRDRLNLFKNAIELYLRFGDY